MEQKVNIIRQLAEQYNKEEYFTGDPIIFPKHFARIMVGKDGIDGLGGTAVLSGRRYTLKDVEIAAVIAAYFITNRIVHPLKKMTVAAKSFAEGDFASRVEVNDRNREVAELAKAFNNMADSLESLEKM